MRNFDVFLRTAPERKPLKKAPEAKPAAKQASSRITAILFSRQIAYLDMASLRIRARTGKVIKRSQLLRVIIEALEESGIDISDVASQADLKDKLLRRLL